MHIKYRLLFVLLLLSLICFSQNKVRVYGYVIDANNRGIELANVYFDNTSTGTSTNQNGYYELNADIADSATLVFSMLGYETIRYTIYPTQKTFPITVELPFVSKEIKDFDVIARRRQSSTIDYVDPSRYRLMPNTSGNIESLLITFAGVSQNNELSSQYNVRGGNFDENIVYVNGTEIYRPLLIRAGQQEGLSFVNPDMVKSLGFSAGGFEARFGDKLSSVLDIQYKKPEAFEASASVSLLGASAYLGTAGKKLTQMHGIRYKTASYLLGTLDTKGEYRPSFVDYQTYITYQLSTKWDMTFLGNFSQNKYEFFPDTQSTSFGTYQTARNLTVLFEGSEKDLFRTAFGALTLNYQPRKNTKLSFTASAFQTNESETYDILGEYTLGEVKTDLNAEDKKGATLGIGKYHQHARNKLNATVANVGHSGEAKTANHYVRWGAQLQYEKITDVISEWEWRDSAGYSLPFNDQAVELYYNMRSTTTLPSLRSSAFVQDTWRNNFEKGLLTVTAGVRASHWSYNNEFFASPRVSVAYLPHWEKDFSFRFATGLYYQSPFYKELRDTVSDANGNVTVALNKDIKAQRSAHFVLGGDHYFRAWGRPFKFTTETYLKLVDRVISYNVDNVRIRYSGENDAVAYTAGVDFKLFGELVPGTDSWINLSLMDSREDILGDSYQKTIFDENNNATGTETVYPGWISRPNEQRYVFSVMFQDYWPNNPKYKVQLRGVWSDGLPQSTPRNPQFKSAFRAPAYRRFDIGASRVLASGDDRIMDRPFFRHFKNIWINAEVLNLFDFANVNSYYWVTDIYNQQYAVPNYLTKRQFNVKIIVDFK